MANEMVPAQAGEIIPAMPNGKMAIPQSWGVGQLAGELITSIDDSTEEGRDRVLQAMSNPDANAQEFLGQVVRVTDVTMHPIEFPDKKTGELTKTVRTLLHLDDGKVIDIRSDGILKSLYLVFRYKKLPPWRPYLACRFTQDPSSNMYLLRPEVAPVKKSK